MCPRVSARRRAGSPTGLTLRGMAALRKAGIAGARRPFVVDLAAGVPSLALTKEFSRHGRPRFRALARALVLFAAGRRAHRSRAWPSWPRPTSSRRWRSPTPTTCSGRWNSPKSSQAPASSRSSAARWPSISATPTTAPATAMPRAERARIVLLAAREDGYRSLMRLYSRAFLDTPSNEPPRLKLDWLEGRDRRHHRAHRRPRRPARCRASPPGRAISPRRGCEALARLFGDRLYVELQRHGTANERADRAGADRSRLRQGPAAGRDQRALFRHRRTTTKRTTR